VDAAELERIVGPMQSIYAIADHVKTLMFAISDGGIPSNVGGGYNLRVLLRRAISFMNEFNFDFEIEKIAEMHADFLKPLFPELSESTEMFGTIFDVEKKRYANTIERSKSIIAKEAKSGRITEAEMEKLYVSHGITPELVERVAGDQKIKIEISEDFYSRITEKHMSHEAPEEQTTKFDTREVPKTKLLFYEDPYAKSFDSTVVKSVKNDKGNWIVLHETLFYPEGGGQPYDMGKISGKDVLRVEKKDGVIFHLTEGHFGEGDIVHGEISWERRYELMKMHTGTHILSGSARKIFGNHIWQAGAQKGLEVSRIDLTHFLPFSYDDLERIEKLANETIEKGIDVDSKVMARKDAEGQFGFVLYQGGASPGSVIRVININENGKVFDVEACGGTHLKNTKEAQMLKILKSERVQDGVNRVEFIVGKQALDFVAWESGLFQEILKKGKTVFGGDAIDARMPKNHYDISRQIQESADIFSIGRDILSMTIEKFINEIKIDHDKINSLRKGKKEHVLKLSDLLEEAGSGKKIGSLPEFSKAVFGLWKHQKKLLESELSSSLDIIADEYACKIKGDGKLIEMVEGDRKFMIGLAEKISGKSPDTIIILANSDGDIVAKSGTADAKKEFENIIKNCHGSGGGRPDFAQGKVKPDLFRKLLNNE
jgi:alanyl-tRNA synthetase